MKGAVLVILCCLLSVPDTTGAVDIQAAPIDQGKPSSPEKDKQQYSIGPRERQKENPLGVWINLFQSKKMSFGCGLSLQHQESFLQSGQRGADVGLGQIAEKVRGCVGFKYSFR